MWGQIDCWILPKSPEDQPKWVSCRISGLGEMTWCIEYWARPDQSQAK